MKFFWSFKGFVFFTYDFRLGFMIVEGSSFMEFLTQKENFFVVSRFSFFVDVWLFLGV